MMPTTTDRDRSRPSQSTSNAAMTTRWVLPFGLGLICGLLFSRPTPPSPLLLTPDGKSTFNLGQAVITYEKKDERNPVDDKYLNDGNNNQEVVEEEEEESADDEEDVVIVGEITALNFKKTMTEDPYLEPVDCQTLLNSYRNQ